MSKGAFAKEDVMEEYLSALLEEPSVDDEIQRESVEKLLKTAAPVIELRESTDDIEEAVQAKVIDVQVDNREAIDQAANLDSLSKLASSEQAASAAIAVKESIVPTGQFQALFFEVSGLKLAVQLTELGGIHQLEKVAPLFGKPDWFQGVMIHRDEKLSVVDTAKWVMPEKYDEKLAESLNYQYLIMLDDSCWGLACERIVTTAVLQPDDVKWREASGKRPWLAGMVKEKMCALVNVQQLIAMLEQGQSSNEK